MATKRLCMIIDTKRCIGCETCCMACKFENNLPNGTWWNCAMTRGGEHMDTPAGTFPNLTMDFLTVSCQHCDDPACAKACPTGATHKREDGLVAQDYDKCIGCRNCMIACPYTGVRTFNWEEPEFAVSHAVGGKGIQKHRRGVVEKCTFCYQRVDAGRLPACVANCPARARYFGDLNDPTSEVSKILRTRKYYQLLPEEGTHPSLYYLV